MHFRFLMGRLPIVLLAALPLLAARPALAQDAAQAAQLDSVTLQPGDLVRVNVYRQPDLTGDYPVDELGRVVFPLIGEMRVSDVPVGELRGRVIDGYRVHLREPSITVTPLRRVNVLGEVRQPGLYPLDPTVSLAGAIAVAGGTTPAGDLDRIRVIRGGQVYRERVGASETLRVAGIRSGDQIIVDQRSWFERNSTFVVSTMLSVTSIVIALVRRR